MDYRIREANTAEKLQRIVVGLIAEGWRPFGCLSVVESQQSGNWWYYQAMVIGAGAEAVGAKPSASGFGDLD